MSREWYFKAMGQEIGPLSAAELKDKVTRGQVQPDTLIRRGPDGKWIFGANVKGLFGPAAEVPTAQLAPPAKPKSATVQAVATGSKPGSNATIPVKGSTKPPSSATIPAMIVTLHEDDTESHTPSMEFYDFVGFREAISPVLHDAVKQFAARDHITVSQLNRRALAHYIKRPELAGDLIISAIAALPQSVNAKSNRDGSHPLSEKEEVEAATFRFTLFNSSHHSIEVGEAAFLPETIEERTYDTIDDKQKPMIDHTGHLPVRLSREEGKAIRIALNMAIPPQATREVFVWFHDSEKPSLLKIRGQFLVGHGGEFSMSEYFTMIVHGDSPCPEAAD